MLPPLRLRKTGDWFRAKSLDCLDVLLIILLGHVSEVYRWPGPGRSPQTSSLNCTCSGTTGSCEDADLGSAGPGGA